MSAIWDETKICLVLQLTKKNCCWVGLWVLGVTLWFKFARGLCLVAVGDLTTVSVLESLLEFFIFIVSYFGTTENGCLVWYEADPWIWWIDKWFVDSCVGGEGRAHLKDVWHEAAWVCFLLLGGAFTVYQQLIDKEKVNADEIKTALYMTFAVVLFMAYEQFMARQLWHRCVSGRIQFCSVVWLIMVLCMHSGQGCQTEWCSSFTHHPQWMLWPPASWTKHRQSWKMKWWTLVWQ